VPTTDSVQFEEEVDVREKPKSHSHRGVVAVTNSKHHIYAATSDKSALEEQQPTGWLDSVFGGDASEVPAALASKGYTFSDFESQNAKQDADQENNDDLEEQQDE
jgi:hypothetical protein